MRTYIALLMSVLILFSLCACGGSSGSNGNDVSNTPTPSTSDIVVSEPQPFEVTISAKNTTTNGGPIFQITSNLPDNTELTLTLENTSGFTAQDKITLQNGQGNSLPFSELGNRLSGAYTLKVTMGMPSLQDQSVQDVIGSNGEYMTGSFVKESDLDGSTYHSIEAEFSFNIKAANSTNSSTTTITNPNPGTDSTSITMGQRNALQTAKQYLSVMAFSYSGLIEQLEYEGYTTDEATYAVDNCGANWYEQAALSAKQYLNVMSFSRQGLIDQLEYEGFSYEQAVYGVEQNGY